MGSVAEARVWLEAGEFAVGILPAAGGKIASIQAGGRELLQLPLGAGYARSKTTAFGAGDASGWDECLPSVAACELATTEGAVSIPDHGDLWRVFWTVRAATANTCTVTGRCFSLPLELERKASLTPVENGARLSLDYNLRNFGERSAPWLWAAHPLFAVEPGDRILLPKTIRTMRVQWSRNGRLGLPGSEVNWPLAELADGARTNLDVVRPAEEEIGDKLFAGRLAEGENWCAVERNALGLRIQVSFDAAATPFLGLWLCYGGWPPREGRKQMCVGLEPTSAPVDSLARAASWSRQLIPGEVSSWRIAVEFLQIRSLRG
jgi:galactose mutarotase-like enzyme